MHPGWKIYGETFFQTRTGVWPLWQGEQHWKVPSRVSGFSTLQCLSSGNSRLLLGPLIRDTSATHLVIFSQQHILQMDILESAVETGDPWAWVGNRSWSRNCIFQQIFTIAFWYCCATHSHRFHLAYLPAVRVGSLTPWPVQCLRKNLFRTGESTKGKVQK